MTKKGYKAQGRHAAGKLRPHCWVVGDDPYKHSMYHPWLKTKAQAKFRGELFELTFEDYYYFWKDCWYNKGRKPENNCLTRKDFDKPWSRNNCEIITRQEQLVRAGLAMRGKPKPKRRA